MTDTPDTSSRRRVAVIGGRGVMGRLCVDLFDAAGHETRSMGSRDWPDADAVLSDADLCILSVPIGVIDAVAAQAAERIPASCVLADVASVKADPLRIMLDAHGGPILGLHPMFGEGSESFARQTVIVCEGRAPDACAWVVDVLRDAEARLVEMSADEHDDLMIYIQVFRHFLMFAYGAFLHDSEADVARVSDLSSTINRIALYGVGRLFAKHGPLYADIMTHDARRRDAVVRLADAFRHYAEMIASGDVDAICAKMDEVRDYLGPYCDLAHDESDFLIDALLRHERETD